MNIIPRQVIPITVLLKEPISKTFPLIGYVPFAALPKKTLKHRKNNKLITFIKIYPLGFPSGYFDLLIEFIVTNLFKTVFTANVGLSIDPLTVSEVGDRYGSATHCN